MNPPAEPPRARREASIRTVHGHTVVDHYAWMRQDGSPELLAYLEAENAWTVERTAHLENLRDQIFEEIDLRTVQTDLSVPEYVRHGVGSAWWYYARTTQGLDYPSYHRCPAADRDHPPLPAEPAQGEVTLLDVNLLVEQEDADFCTLGSFEVSPDGHLLAYSVDLTGAERYELRLRDLTSGDDLAIRRTGIAGGGCWRGDRSFLYLTVDDAWRPDRCWQLHLGGGEDVLIHHEPDERFWLGVDESRDRAWVHLQLASKTSTESWLLRAADPEAGAVLVAARQPGVEYDVEVHRDWIYLVHNRDAPDFSLSRAPLASPDPANWQTIRPGAASQRLLAVSAYDRALVLSVRRAATPELIVIPILDDGRLGGESELAFPEGLRTIEAEGNEDADTDRIRLTYESMVTPEQVIEVDLDTGQRTILKQRRVKDHPVLGRYRPEDYIARREWATSADGTRIPISVVHRRDTPLDGTAGCLLYGYGAYEISLADTFSIARLSLLDRGYVHAVAHVRGGGELGRSWYDQGRREHKQNTFTDFIACARHLVEAGYTTTERLAAEGGSAGGLLIGAVANQAPDAFGALHAAVPFVDVLTTILDPDQPLTVTEWDEWGDPLHDPQAYRRILSYSPYDNVTARPLPDLLVTASLSDVRVDVGEAAKWVARLRHHSPRDPAALLLRTELHGGHGGASGRYAAWRDAAFELAWLMAATSADAGTTATPVR